MNTSVQSQLNRFPILSTETFQGKSRNYPSAFSGNPSLIILLFGDLGKYPKVLSQADEWLEIWEATWKTRGMGVQQIPMFSSKWKFCKKPMYKGLNHSLKKKHWENTSCFFGDTQKYKRQLSIYSNKKAQIFLLDSLGYILDQRSGYPSFKQLASWTKSLDPSDKKSVKTDPLINFDLMCSRGKTYV